MTSNSVTIHIVFIILVIKMTVGVDDSHLNLKLENERHLRRHLFRSLQLDQLVPLRTFCMRNYQRTNCLVIPGVTVNSFNEASSTAHSEFWRRTFQSSVNYRNANISPVLNKVNNQPAFLPNKLPTDRYASVLLLPHIYQDSSKKATENNKNNSDLVHINKKLIGVINESNKLKTITKLGTLLHVKHVDPKNSMSITNTTSTNVSSSLEITAKRISTRCLDGIHTQMENIDNNTSLFSTFLQSLDQFQRKFYEVTFNKLTSISPKERQDNGISFIQSGLFLYLFLIALSMEADPESRTAIDKSVELTLSDEDKLQILKEVVTSLPASNEVLKFRWSTRLVVGNVNMSLHFQNCIAPVLRLHINQFNKTDTPEDLRNTLNHMVEMDSGGAMRDTFEESELSPSVRAVVLSTVYVRAGWRSAPTLLNGTRPFYDSEEASRPTRMIRINDIMRYADLTEWDAEAIELSYATPGLTMLLMVPRGRSLRTLATHVATTSLQAIANKMHQIRVAAILPLYTLRMTLLLPSKLQSMGLQRLVETESNNATSDTFRLSHAVQRLMFWAEAGRKAYKDDGIEWDEPPELELVVDRPYIFFVRWKNITIVNGNFVL